LRRWSIGRRLGHLARVARALPPHRLLAKAAGLARRQVAGRLAAIVRRRACPYPPCTHERLAPRLPPLEFSGLAPHADTLAALVALILDHRFDLLGSGWVRVAHGERHRGFQGHTYPAGPALPADPWAALAATLPAGARRRAAALFALIDRPGYRPIDWHVDARSGFRWSPSTWGGLIAYGHRPGIDVKWPWELARLQHLVPLAQAAALAAARTPGLPAPALLAAEFRAQVLDFLGANPPGWGVNWACAMDVAIRAANIVVAWGLFRAQGIAFDDAFEAELAAAMRAHGRFLAANLEWHGGRRGNHYLADLAGLAFVAAHLDRDAESDLWLAFAAQQLDAEIIRQFTPDGANFEASVAYHRLSGEIALYAAALLLGLPAERAGAFASYDAGLWRHRGPPAPRPAPMQGPPLSAEALARLSGVAAFARATTKPSGEMVQIGDHDSGRFLKLTPLFDLGPDGPAERHLDPRGLIGAAHGLFALPGAAPPGTAFESALVAALAGGARVPVAARRETVPAQPAAMPLGRRLRLRVPDPTALAGLVADAYPAFGLYLWRNERAFVAVRCGPIGQDGHGGHAHNDQLAVEIEIDGVPWARDPGSFVYTADLAARDRYRSVLAHFAPRRGTAEPAAFLSPFRLEDRARAEALRFGPDFLGRHHGFGAPVWRRVAIEDGAIVIEDGPAAPGETEITTPGDLARLWGLDLPFSPGYGLIRP